MSRLVRVATLLAAGGTVHAAINARALRRPAVGASCTERVSVLLPVRDEARHIDECLRTLMRQDVHEIVVLDDQSIDGTADIARAVSAHDDRVRVIDGAQLPRGWLGKPWACAQLAAAADPNSAVLVFVDADVRLASGAVGAACALLRDAQLDVVSPFPRQRAESAAERLVQPLLQWSWLTLLPLRLAERSPRPSLTAATGQFLVINRDAYERAGGHSGTRGDVVDDIALVRAIKATGWRGGVVDGTELAQCRMYDGWAELRDGYTKSLWDAFGSERGAVAVAAGLSFAYVLPALAALRGSRAGALGYLAGVAGRIVSAQTTGGRVLPDAGAHPISVLCFDYLVARSIVEKRRGRLRWKGRQVTPAS
jgi:Glycosyltransferase like family 2